MQEDMHVPWKTIDESLVAVDTLVTVGLDSERRKRDCTELLSISNQPATDATFTNPF